MPAIVGFLLAPDFDEIEFRTLADRIECEGDTLLVIGGRAGDELTGMEGDEHVLVDRGFEEIDPEDLHGVIVVGGRSPRHLARQPEALAFLQRQFLTGHPLVLLSTASDLALAAGVLTGSRVAAPRSRVARLRDARCSWVDRDLVIDGHLLSARDRGALPGLADALVSALRAAEAQTNPNEYLHERSPIIPA